MLGNLKLSYKGILMVSVLLLMELGFVGALAVLLSETEQSALKEEHTKKVVGVTNRVLGLIYDAGNSGNKFIYNQMPEESRRFHEAVGALSPELKQLKSLCKDNPDYLKRVQIIESNVFNTLQLVNGAVRLTEAGKHQEALLYDQRTTKEYRKGKTATLNEIRSFMDDQEKIVADSPADRAKMRDLEEKLLLVGVGLNIVLVIAIALLFTRGITTRLGIMVANTQRLAKNEKLNPQLTGNDEIAMLDRSFHQMAADLKELEEVKQQFVAMVSHDLRTPLTSVKGFLELLAGGVYGDLNETGEHRAGLAQRNITRLISLINDLLDYEKLQSGKFSLDCREIDVASPINRSIDALRFFAEKEEVALETQEVDLKAYADEERLVQVLVNLISNSVKFSPKGGKVTITAVKKDNFVEFNVIDQGRGVPKNMQEAIFERFKQVKTTDATEKGGTGLGLPICKALVECHYGRIGVDSEEGKGSRFWFTIPVTKPVEELAVIAGGPATATR
ncbi:MAG: hypothetical protein K2X77_12850 [Candidatus Obscuribacterales bacterium]|jgi:signal transduction histidine kinase|nr:hypothetical protein [Candidatus Obscuribacterales bacterium]